VASQLLDDGLVPFLGGPQQWRPTVLDILGLDVSLGLEQLLDSLVPFRGGI
jgi:hypothetical protein